MIIRPFLVSLLVATGLVVVVACGGKSGSGSVEYSVSAQKNYDKGLKMLESKDWVAASKYFGFIKSRFPYSKYAVLAELRLADAEFGAEQYLEGIDSYRLFIKFHPTHEMVANGYVSFRIGESYFKQLPGDFWMFPPSFEKDQSSTEDAANELKSFLDKYPDSPYRKQSKEILVRLGKRLADHEWYVASFYAKRDKWPAVINRLNIIARDFPGIGLDEKVHFALYDAWMELKDEAKAKDALRALVKKSPESDGAKKAARMLGPQG